MSMPSPYDRVIMEHLISTFNVASEAAFLFVLDEIAQRAGIQTLGPDGLSVRDSYHQRKYHETEQLIAEFADFSPNAATDLKKLWQQLDDAKESEAES